MSDLIERATDAMIADPPRPPTPIDDLRRRAEQRHRRRATVVVTACVVVVALGLATMAIARRPADPADPASADDRPPETTVVIETGEPVIWRPRASDSVRIVSRSIDPMVASWWTGTVVSPTGSVVGIDVGQSNADADGLIDTDQVRRIGSYDVHAVADATAPGQVYHWLVDGCATVSAATAGDAMWSGDVVSLFESLTIADAVRFDLPPGWISLGSAGWTAQYRTELEVLVGNDVVPVTMLQATDSPIGVYVGGRETPPRQVRVGETTAWYTQSATTPGYASLAGERDGTAYVLSGELSEAQLVELASSLVRAPVEDWTSSAAGGVDVTAATTGGTISLSDAACDVPSLEIVTAR